MNPLITSIVVSFFMNSTNAVYCTKPMPWVDAVALASKVDSMAWSKNYPNLTPPNVIAQDHPNYAVALSGKTFTDPSTNSTVTISPCAPFPVGTGLE